MKKVKLLPLCNAILFSLFIIIGHHLDEYETIMNIFESDTALLGLIIFLLVLTITFYIIIDKLYSLLDRKKSSRNINKGIPKVINFMFYDHPFATMFLTSLIVSIIYLIFFYPGILTFDGKWQINSFHRDWEFNDHHPAILSTFMGFLLDIGRLIANDNLGIFLYISMQVLVNALVYGYVLKIMNKINSPLSIRIITFLFFGFFPYINLNSITYMKDIMYYLIFLLLLTYQWYHLEVEDDTNKKVIINLVLLYLLLFLFRNTGFYVGAISTIFLIFLNIVRKNYNKVKVAGICLVSILIFNGCYHHIILPMFNIGSGPIRERLSIPFQQTARYLNYYRDDVTNDEEEMILTLFTRNLDYIASEYNPYRSDRVKGITKDNPTSEELVTYFKAWWSMFKKHPWVYVDATLNNTYGYFYSSRRNFMGEDIGFYNHSPNKHTDVHFVTETQNIRDTFKNIADKICHTKIIGLLYSCWFYVWILIFLSFYILHKKYYDLFIYFFPFYVTLLLALVSPVNGHLRYVFPLMVSMPIAISMVIYRNRNSK